MLLGMTDIVLQTVITAAGTTVSVLGSVAVAYMNYLTKTAVVKTAKDAAIAAKEVKVKLNEVTEQNKEAAEAVSVTLQKNTEDMARKVDEIAKTGEATHILVNSAMGAQKKLLAVTARALADKTGDATDISAADEAERDHAAHTGKQDKVDNLKGEQSL